MHEGKRKARVSAKMRKRWGGHQRRKEPDYAPEFRRLKTLS